MTQWSLKIRHGNGVLVVVRAGESPVHGEGEQFIMSKTKLERCVRHYEKSKNSLR